MACSIPDDVDTLTARPRREARTNPPARRLSRRGDAIHRARIGRDPSKPSAFAVGIPAVDAFPVDLWHRLLSRRSRGVTREQLSFGSAAGYLPLRRAVASYLATARGVTCAPEQVLITTSSQQGLDIATRVLADPGDEAWIEEPGYLGARGVFVASALNIIPVPVDQDGMDVARGKEYAPLAKIAYVTPSHQFPLGATMSLDRRLALLRWAKSAGAWIFEDDYDSEFRYEGRPLAALQGLDNDERVIYIGTFTKVMFPSLRLGYVVVPRDLVDAFVATRRLMDIQSNTLMQATLTDFIDGGHFGSHIRRMRALYQERQKVFLEAAARHLSATVQLEPDPAGLHLVGRLASGTSDVAIMRQAARNGVQLSPLSQYYCAPQSRPGLVLGYAGVGDRDIREGVASLARAIDEVSGHRRRA